MAEKKGVLYEQELRNYGTEDEDSVNLLTNGDQDTNKPQDDKKSVYDQQSLGSWCSTNYKLLLGGIAVVSLILLGIVVGAVSTKNKVARHLGRNARSSFPYQHLRLPNEVLPLKYRIYLHPNLTNFRVKGRVRILVNCVTETDRVILHSKSNLIGRVIVLKGDFLNAKSSRTDVKEKDVVRVENHMAHKKRQLLLIQLGSKLKPGGNYTVIIGFNGSLADGLEGFYKSSYKTKAGEKRYIATTFFESSNARSAFPCFDEPALKAQFSIIMVRESKYKALSNMPVERTIHRNDGLLVDHFQESVKMSTYLVAFVVCDFAYKESFSKRGIKMRVYAPADQIEQAQFAIETAPKVLDYYEKFFKVNFPLPKQDLIAIPDFAAGAMENWGLITYRLTSLLYDPKESSESNKQWVAVVIAHEMAHQWFGNLVTMKWWNDLWLNEGFAAYMEFIGVNHVNRDWKMMDQFIIDDTQTSLSLDSHANSHPISVTVQDPAQINSIFDSISYDKGASIIRMMRNFIGMNNFQTGLQNYLEKYKFSNAASDDLWAELTKATDNKIDVKGVMDTWTLQMGYPLITIKRDLSTGDVYATQKHFLLDPTAKLSQKSPFGYRWKVPFTFKTENGKPRTSLDIVWMNPKDNETKLSWPLSAGWIKANVDSLGFYRVNYEVENWRALTKQLIADHKALNQSDRANIIDDAFELARGEELGQTIALDLTRYLKSEEDYVPWHTALASLGYISGVLKYRPGYKEYEEYILQKVHSKVKKLGWKDEGSHLRRYLRGIILSTATAHNDSDAVREARKLFDDYKYKNISVPSNLKGVVYSAGIKYGDEDDWNFIWKKHQESQIPTETKKLMYCLADSTNPKILKKYLAWSLDSSKIRSQDTTSVIQSIAANKYGQQLAWDFVRDKWNILYDRYHATSFELSGLIKYVCGGFVTKDKLEEVKKFFADKDAGTAKRAVSQSIENIKNRIMWLEKHEEEVLMWFKKHQTENN